MDLAAIEAARLTAYRFKCQGKWRNTGLGHIKHEFLHKYLFTLNQDKILKKYQLVKPFKITIATSQDWQKSSTPTWTIGSHVGREFTTDWVQVFLGPCTRESTAMGSLFTVFPAKVIAKNFIRRGIQICSGSTCKATTESSFVWECRQLPGKLREFSNVTLVWIPGQRGGRQSGQGRGY
jgi:hypothetical protein